MEVVQQQLLLVFDLTFFITLIVNTFQLPDYIILFIYKFFKSFRVN